MDTYVFLEKPEMVIPEYSGRGRRSLKAKPSIPPIQVKQVADDESMPWNKVILGEGAKGPIIAHEKCIRIVRCDSNCPGDAVWLYIRRLEDGTCKYSFSNAPWDTSVFAVREAALMRWPIEQCFLECKNELGLDHCEARSWNSWHRHTLLVLARQRQPCQALGRFLGRSPCGRVDLRVSFLLLSAAILRAASTGHRN